MNSVFICLVIFFMVVGFFYAVTNSDTPAGDTFELLFNLSIFVLVFTGVIYAWFTQ